MGDLYLHNPRSTAQTPTPFEGSPSIPPTPTIDPVTEDDVRQYLVNREKASPELAASVASNVMANPRAPTSAYYARMVAEARKPPQEKLARKIAAANPAVAQGLVDSTKFKWVRPAEKGQQLAAQTALKMAQGGAMPDGAMEAASKLYAPLLADAFLGYDGHEDEGGFAQHTMDNVTDSLASAGGAIGGLFQGD